MCELGDRLEPLSVTRDGELDRLGFSTLPSQANFLLTRPPEGLGAREYYERLWEQRVLIRWLDLARVRQYVRITVGSNGEIDRLLEATREMLKVT